MDLSGPSCDLFRGVWYRGTVRTSRQDKPGPSLHHQTAISPKRNFSFQILAQSRPARASHSSLGLRLAWLVACAWACLACDLCLGGLACDFCLVGLWLVPGLLLSWLEAGAWAQACWAWGSLLAWSASLVPCLSCGRFALWLIWVD